MARSSGRNLGLASLRPHYSTKAQSDDGATDGLKAPLYGWRIGLLLMKKAFLLGGRFRSLFNARSFFPLK